VDGREGAVFFSVDFVFVFVGGGFVASAVAPELV
jgi:hypothetical protein|tara:strand:+ start:7474 stop:7575 length:102 start_codon:yes stop_codon:yes gene_type:complete